MLTRRAGFDGETDGFFSSYPGFFELYVGVRSLNAVVGGLVVPAMYLSLRFMKCSRLAAFFGELHFAFFFRFLFLFVVPEHCYIIHEGAWLAAFENIFVLESRLILTDAYLLLFFVLSMAGTFAVSRQIVFSWQWLLALILTGLALGCTLSVKFTGLGAVGLVGVHQLYHLLTWHVFGMHILTTPSSPQPPQNLEFIILPFSLNL